MTASTTHPAAEPLATPPAHRDMHRDNQKVEAAVDQIAHALQAVAHIGQSDPTSAPSTPHDEAPASAPAATTPVQAASSSSLTLSPQAETPPTCHEAVSSPLARPAQEASSLGPVDETILNALRNSRDRVFYMQHEREMALFVRDTTRHRLDLPLMNTYQRLLVHRCADQFLLGHHLDPATKAVTLTKTAETRMPELRISQRAAALLSDRDPTGARAGQAQIATPRHSASSPAAAASASALATASPTGASATPPSGFRIMRRNPTASSRGSLTPGASTSGSNSDSERSELAGCGKQGRKDRKHMTIEEREAAYKAARERIFGVSEPGEGSKGEAKGATAATSGASTSFSSNGGGSSGSGNAGKQGSGSGGGGGRKKGHYGNTSHSGSLNGSVDSSSRGRSSVGRRADVAASVDDDLLGFSRNMTPPSSSTGLWTPHGYVQPSPQLRHQRDAMQGLAAAGTAPNAYDGQPSQVPPQYLATGAGPGIAPGQYSYAAADANRYVAAMQPQQQARAYFTPPDLGIVGGARAAPHPHLRAKAPAFMPPSTQGGPGQWFWTPEASSSRGSSTPGSDVSVSGLPRQQAGGGGGAQYPSSGAPREREVFSPFPASNPSSTGGSRPALTSSPGGLGLVPSVGGTSSPLSSDHFPALPGASRQPVHSQGPSAAGAWKGPARSHGQGVWDRTAPSPAPAASPQVPLQQDASPCGPYVNGNGYPSASAQAQWSGSSNGNGAWQQQQQSDRIGGTVQHQQQHQQQQQQQQALPHTANGPRPAAAGGAPTFAGSNGAAAWHTNLHAQGYGRYQRAPSSSGMSSGSASGGGPSAAQSKDDSMSVTSNSSTRSSQPISSGGPVAHPSLPSKPLWIQKNGSGSEAGTPSARPQTQATGEALGTLSSAPATAETSNGTPTSDER
ncbi:hypothetical protein ACQY0O_006668 [Thecaphora frezii]